MSQIQCLRIRLRPGTTDRMADFLRGLADRPDEVAQSLAAEGIERESLFLDRAPDGDHLIFITRADDLEAAAEAFQNSQLPLDVETRELISETWQEVRQLELLADLP